MNSASISRSPKQGFSSEESYLVTRGRSSYLRIVGQDNTYSLMTATADEDDRSYLVETDQVRLMLAAVLLSSELGLVPRRKFDSMGRVFLYISNLTFHSGQEDAELQELKAILESFFVLFDKLALVDVVVAEEMKQVYASLKAVSEDVPVRISEEMILSPDGELHLRKY